MHWIWEADLAFGNGIQPRNKGAGCTAKGIRPEGGAPKRSRSLLASWSAPNDRNKCTTLKSVCTCSREHRRGCGLTGSNVRVKNFYVFTAKTGRTNRAVKPSRNELKISRFDLSLEGGLAGITPITTDGYKSRALKQEPTAMGAPSAPRIHPRFVSLNQPDSTVTELQQRLKGQLGRH